jgi:hypothetical protein
MTSFFLSCPAGDRHQNFFLAAALRGFLAGLFGAAALVAAPVPTLFRRSASIRSTILLPRGRSFGVIGLVARFPLISRRAGSRKGARTFSGSKLPLFLLMMCSARWACLWRFWISSK